MLRKHLILYDFMPTTNRQLMLTVVNITNCILCCIFFSFSFICELWFIQLALSCVQGVTVHGNVCWHLYVQSLHAPKMLYWGKNTYPNSCELYFYRISEQYNLTYVLYQFTIEVIFIFLVRTLIKLCPLQN